MLSCKEIVKLLNSEDKVSFTKRAELRMHLMMCKHCSAYSKHLESMKNGFRDLFKKLTDTDPDHVQELEKKIIEKAKRSSNQQ